MAADDDLCWQVDMRCWIPHIVSNCNVARCNVARGIQNHLNISEKHDESEND